MTNDKDEEIRPRWHPDGKQILYNAVQDEYSQIKVAYADGRPSHQITRGDRDYEMIDVSADGSKIFYTTLEKTSDISSVNIENGEELEVATGIEFEFWIDVSPDGKSILYQSKSEPGFDKSSIVIKSLSNQNRQLSLKGFNPHWLPDSRHVAFLRWSETEQKFHLWLVNIVTSTEKQLTTDGVSLPSMGILPTNRGEISTFSWSPESRRFVYLDSQKQNVWTTSIESPETFNLTNNENPNVRYYSPLWLPDEKRILYVSTEKPAEKTQKPTWHIWLNEQGESKKIFSTTASLTSTWLVGFGR